MASKKSSDRWDDVQPEQKEPAKPPKAEPGSKEMSKRAEAWIAQTEAQFGDVDITAGSDFLQSDFTAINDLPENLQPYWGRPGQDLTASGYMKADPQPDHEMTARGHTLWLTRKDMFLARKERERAFSQRRMEFAGTELSGPATRKAGQEDIKPLTKADGEW